jgi:hypothetical protein
MGIKYCFLTLRKDNELQFSENKMPMKETESKKDEATEQFKITHNKKFIKLFTFFISSIVLFFYLKQRFRDQTLPLF